MAMISTVCSSPLSSEAVGQFERALIKERQREGILIAKTKKLYKGRKPALDDAGVAKLKKIAAEGSAEVEIAKTFGISRASVDAYLNGSVGIIQRTAQK